MAIDPIPAAEPPAGLRTCTDRAATLVRDLQCTLLAAIPCYLHAHDSQVDAAATVREINLTAQRTIFALRSTHRPTRPATATELDALVRLTDGALGHLLATFDRFADTVSNT